MTFIVSGFISCNPRYFIFDFIQFELNRNCNHENVFNFGVTMAVHTNLSACTNIFIRFCALSYFNVSCCQILLDDFSFFVTYPPTENVTFNSQEPEIVASNSQLVEFELCIHVGFCLVQAKYNTLKIIGYMD